MQTSSAMLRLDHRRAYCAAGIPGCRRRECLFGEHRGESVSLCRQRRRGNISGFTLDLLTGALTPMTGSPFPAVTTRNPGEVIPVAVLMARRTHIWNRAPFMTSLPGSEPGFSSAGARSMRLPARSCIVAHSSPAARAAGFIDDDAAVLQRVTPFSGGDRGVDRTDARSVGTLGHYNGKSPLYRRASRSMGKVGSFPVLRRRPVRRRPTS